MNPEQENTATVIDSFGAFTLYKNDDGSYVASREYPIFVEYIDFFDDSFSIEIDGPVVGYSDWEDCRGEMEEALEAAEHFQDIINAL